MTTSRETEKEREKENKKVEKAIEEEKRRIGFKGKMTDFCLLKMTKG